MSRASTVIGLPEPHSRDIVADQQAQRFVVPGQLGIRPDGTVPDGFEAQHDQIWKNTLAILADAGMDFGDLVRINAYVTDRAHLAAYMRSRDRHVAAPPPASTLMIVSGFAREAFEVEIECIAARVDGPSRLQPGHDR